MVQMHCTQAGEAGRLGDGPDVRDFTESRMSGLAGWMSGLEELTLLLSVWRVPDFRGRGGMSGTWRGAGCPGLTSDVRGLEHLAAGRLLL